MATVPTASVDSEIEERELPTLDGIHQGDALPCDIRAHVAAVRQRIVLPRRSATELMRLETDPTGHRDTYVLGIPDRRLFTRGECTGTPRGVPARILGDVLHLSLEEQIADADLDRFHERELSGMLDEPATSPRVQAAVRKLRELVTASRANPVVAALYDAPHAERELSFTWIRRPPSGSPAIIHGAMDLVAAPDGVTMEILDYKSHTLEPGTEAATAAGYELQRDLYAEALRAILGAAPGRFTFFFPATNTPVATDLSAVSSDARLARIDRLLTLEHGESEPGA